MTKKCNDLTRREAIINAGKIAAGAAVVSVGAHSLISPARATTPSFPWGYKKLDLQQVGDLAYNEWYKSFCCQAVVTAGINPLQTKIGEPYASLPLSAF